jgi:N utilization substance protein B
MDIAGSGILETVAEYEEHRFGREIDGVEYRPADVEWFRIVLAGVVENQRKIDPVVNDSLLPDWPLSRIDSTMRALLRGATFDIMMRLEVPTNLIVDGYLEVAKAFYGEEEPKVVNAVLDRVARRLRGEGRGQDAS